MFDIDKQVAISANTKSKLIKLNQNLSEMVETKSIRDFPSITKQISDKFEMKTMDD